MDRELCWNVCVCRVGVGETQEEHLSDVAHEIHESAVLTVLE